jgi:A118 family predicted phage portal protein
MNVRDILQKLTGGKRLPTRSPYIDTWQSWYRGNVRDFHNYCIFNGEANIEISMKSMQMAKFICEKWADLLLNEKCDIILPKAIKDKFDKILNRTNFWYKANNGLEKSFALGYGALVVNVNGLEIGDKGSVKKSGKIGIDYIDAFKIHPITIENGVLTECAFESRNTNSTNLVVHLKENGKYVIHNYMFDDKNIISRYEFNTKSEVAWFQLLQPNIANNLNDQLTDDELGISVYANSIDSLKDLDSKYDSFYQEYVLGRKRIFLSSKAYRVDIETGERIKSFDPRDTQFYFLPTDDDGKQHITEQQSDIRSVQIIEGINAQLNYLGMKCGLGQNFFKFDGGGDMTATQVISENSTLFRNLKKHEIIIEDALKNLTKVIIQASNEFTDEPLGKINDDEIKILFDDSIIEDKEAQMKRDKEDVAAGLLSKEEYRMKWYGEDEDTAKNKVREYFHYELIDKYTPALVAGAITPEMFVDKVYGEVENKQEVIEYIKKAVTTGDTFDLYNSAEGDIEEVEEPEEEEVVE